MQDRSRTCTTEGSGGGTTCSEGHDMEMNACNTDVACDDGASKFKLSKTAYLQNRG